MSEGSCNSPVDIILALDASGSVLKVNWEKSVDFTGSLAEKLLKLNPESRIGVIDFSQVVNEAISPTSDREGLNLRLETVRNSYQNGITRTELALNKALEMFNRINKQGRKKRLLVITDGVTTPLNGMVGLELLKMPVESLESAGVTIIVVGVGNQVNDEELNLMATGPDKENVFRIENYDNLPDIVGILSQAFCQVNNSKGKTTRGKTLHGILQNSTYFHGVHLSRSMQANSPFGGVTRSQASVAGQSPPLALAISRGSLHSLAINGELAGRLCISIEFNEMIVRECPGLVFL